jgi:hypothetical protein
MIPDNIQLIKDKIQEAELLKKSSQNSLMDYCLNKNFPLNERWEIWKEFVIKSEESFLMDSSDFESPIIKYIAQINYDRDYERHTEVDYSDFLESVYNIDSSENSEIITILRDLKIDFINSEINEKFSIFSIVKEEIMKENFGSYKYDW